MLQLETEWKNNRKEGGLQRLNSLAKDELDWDRLSQLADQCIITIFTNNQTSNN